MFTIYPTEYPRIAHGLRLIPEQLYNSAFEEAKGNVTARHSIDSRSELWSCVKQVLEDHCEAGFVALLARATYSAGPPVYCAECMWDRYGLIRMCLQDRFGPGVQDIPGDWYTKYYPAKEVISYLDRLLMRPEASSFYSPKCSKGHELRDGDYVMTILFALRDATFRVEFYKSPSEM